MEEMSTSHAQWCFPVIGQFYQLNAYVKILDIIFQFSGNLWQIQGVEIVLSYMFSEDDCGVSVEDELRRRKIKVRQYNWNTDYIVYLEMAETWTKIELR